MKPLPLVPHPPSSILLATFACMLFGVQKAALAQSQVPASSLRQYVSNEYHPIGDYVPCLFDSDEEFVFRAQAFPNAKPVLDSSGADQFVKLVQGDIMALFGKSPEGKEGQTATSEPAGKPMALSRSLSPDPFLNLTMTAAIDKLTADAWAGGLSAADTQKLVSMINAQTGITGAERPDDVSCSFSILTWNEADEIFGRMVANNYVVIQVTVRNLNKQNEFLLHDIQVAVDTGLDQASFGRFQAGRDKLMVRSLAQRGESDEVRNRVVNALAMAGAIAGGASGALTQTIGGANNGTAIWLSEAVSIFQGPFLSGLNKLWPDHTVDNVTAVSDLGFSSSSTMKTVIPIQGAVPLVTFVAQKPLGQLPFALCGRKKGGDYQQDGTACALTPATGFTENDFQSNLSFKKWSPAAMNILEHRTFVVVAGMHIQEAAPSAAVKKITCPTVEDGTIDLSAQDASHDIACNVTGTSLNSILSAKLEQGPNTNISATFDASANGSSGTLSFAASSFNGINGTFEVLGVDGSGKTTNLGQAIKFAVRSPVIDSVSYNPDPAQLGKELTVTLPGSNLDRIADVYLTNDSATPSSVDGKISEPAKVLSTAKSITVKFEWSDLAKLAPNAEPEPGTGKPVKPAPKPSASITATVQYDVLDDTAKTKTKRSVGSGKDKGVSIPAS